MCQLRRLLSLATALLIAVGFAAAAAGCGGGNS